MPPIRVLARGCACLPTQLADVIGVFARGGFFFFFLLWIAGGGGGGGGGYDYG